MCISNLSSLLRRRLVYSFTNTWVSASTFLSVLCMLCFVQGIFICSCPHTFTCYIHASVIATTVRQLWCFPKKVQTRVIPRFKIVDAYFTLGPRRVHWLFWWLLLFTIFFITFGALFGGCKETETYSYYGGSSSSKNSGACGTMVVGILLIIPMLLLLFIPCCFKL